MKDTGPATVEFTITSRTSGVRRRHTVLRITGEVSHHYSKVIYVVSFTTPVPTRVSSTRTNISSNNTNISDESVTYLRPFFTQKRHVLYPFLFRMRVVVRYEGDPTSPFQRGPDERNQTLTETPEVFRLLRPLPKKRPRRRPQVCKSKG